jgi:predicted GNAT superfamily acetyltransferase
VEADWAYIESLRRKEGAALGFIPKEAYESVFLRKRVANRDRWKTQRLLVTVDNGDLTGFCYASFAAEMAHIIQICVQADARRWHRALLMTDEVEAEAQRSGNTGVTCRVAYDLESNFFWRGIGFMPVRQVVSSWLNQKESKSRRPLWVYVKHFNRLFEPMATAEEVVLL